MSRISWDDYFLKIAMLVAERSTCLRHHVGAIVVKNKRILSTGYNGAPGGVTDCLDKGCLRNELKIPSGQRHEICKAVHAEQNVIIQAGLHGVSIGGGTLFCTHTPCMICAKMVVNAQLVRYVTYGYYADEEARDFLRSSGIEIVVLSKPDEHITSLD